MKAKMPTVDEEIVLTTSTTPVVISLSFTCRITYIQLMSPSVSRPATSPF